MPYSACAKSKSPLASFSRTPVQEASLVGRILMPCFLSKPITEAMTTEAQSVSGIKPIFTSVFSGASEPAAHADDRTRGSATDRMLRLAATFTGLPSHARRCRSADDVTEVSAALVLGLRASVIGVPGIE